METLQIFPKKGYSIVQLNRAKANAINHTMVNELRQSFVTLSQDIQTKGVVLTGIPGFFSAGLDVIELYQYDRKAMHAFFIDFSLLHVEMVQFKKPLVCAVTGHCPAGGTVLAITADYRVMADDPKFSIGLNEVAVNVQISQNLIEAYSFWLGRGLANRFVLAGKLLNPQEAADTNLVDEICPSHQVLDRAEKTMNQYLNADEDIFTNSKAKLRKTWLDNIDAKSPEELAETEAIWWKPEVRVRMKKLIESFSNKK